MDRVVRRGKDGKDWRSLAFARAFASALISLNYAIYANRSERVLDKLGVTGSSPVPPIISPLSGVFGFPFGNRSA
jgi:hypothetical protein